MVVRELITKLGFNVDNGQLKKYEQSIESTKNKISSLGTGISKVSGVMKLIGGVVATAGITALGKSILETTGEIEQYRVTLGTMIGDQEKANKIIHDLDYSPVSDFYGTASAIGGLQGMVTFGMDAEKASDTLTRLGDIAQGNTEAFKSLSLNMGQVFAKGKADATDLKQFVGQGFDVVGEVSKMTGKSRAEIEKAGVSYEQCAMALEHITNEGGKYYGMLQKQSNTLPGLIKQFQSLTAAIKESIGTEVLGGVKSLMNYFLNLGRSMQDSIVDVGTRAFKAVLKGIANVIVAFEVVSQRTKRFEGFRKLILGISNAFGMLGRVILDVFMDVAPVVDKIAGLFANLLNFVGKHRKAFIEFGKVAVAVIMGIMGAIKIAHITNQIRETIKTAQGLFNIFKANPMMIAIALVIAGLVLVVTHLDQIKQAWANMSTPLKVLIGIIGGIVGAVLAVVTAVKTFTMVMGVAKAIMIIFNAICAVNPLILIIMGIILAIGLLIAGIVAVVKNWDKVKEAFFKFAGWCKNLFKSLVEGIKAIWNKISEFFVALWEGIKSVFFAVVNWIINLWNSIIGFFQNLWENIKNVFNVFVEWVSGIWTAVIDVIKNIWNGIIEFYTNLWESIKSIFMGFVDWLSLLFTDPIEAFKQAWSGITDFFQNLWENVFSIFTGFTDKVKNVWSGIKSFFGFGDSDVNVNQTKNVSAVDKAKETSAGVSNSYASTINNNSNPATINSSSNITVNVPQGTSAEQAEAISRQVQAQIDASWADVLNGSRAMVPSPEARSF